MNTAFQISIPNIINMFINVESKKIFNDAGIEKVFKSAEKLALDRFDMT